MPRSLSRRQMQEDLAELVTLLTESHPDPYRRVGGAVAFHRVVDQIARGLPEETSHTEFLRLLRPLVAAVRDGHTAISAPQEASSSPAARPWLDWDVVGEDLYLSRVYDAAHRPLLGARLLAIDDVPIAGLQERMAELRGYDNEVDLLRRLAHALEREEDLLDLLARRDRVTRSTFSLMGPDDHKWTLEVPWTHTPPGSPSQPPSSISLPTVGTANLGWGFVDAHRRVACLRVGELMRYREAFEIWRGSGFTQNLEERLRAILPEATPADGVDALIAKVSSATELLQDFFTAIREARTKALVVDLREATGGNSALAYILGAFLFGEEQMALADDGYQIRRYSPLYLKNYGELPEGADLSNGGYDFRDEVAFLDSRNADLRAAYREELRAAARQYARIMPTFDAARGTLSSHSDLLRIAVVTSAFTYSAGFDVTAMLVRRGALHVGVPSGQAGNCFIDILRFRLTHSGLAGTVSFKESFLFPEDPVAGYLLRPQQELTYERLASYDFDANAGVRLAIEELSSRE